MPFKEEPGEPVLAKLRGNHEHRVTQNLIVNKAVHGAVAMQPQIKHRPCARQTLRMNQRDALEIDRLDETIEPLMPGAPR